jgi:hypothetical protein
MVVPCQVPAQICFGVLPRIAPAQAVLAGKLKIEAEVPGLKTRALICPAGPFAQILA